MITRRKFAGIAMATAAAGLFAAAAIPSSAVAAEAAMVHCMGVNACKGKSDCASASNSCKGQNACKGKGFIAMTDKECKAKGGKPEAAK